nr:MAG TPA: hypothetical protein [Caudoviricetes sp.]
MNRRLGKAARGLYTEDKLRDTRAAACLKFA